MVLYMEVVSGKRDMVQSKLAPFARNDEGRKSRMGDTHRKKGAPTCMAQF